MILFVKTAKLSRKEEVPSLPSTRIREVSNAKNNKPLKALIRQRLEDRIVDNAEDGRGSADSKSQGSDGDKGETAILAEVAEGVAEVAGEAIEVGSHTSKLYTEAAVNCRDLKMNDRRVAPTLALYSMLG
jgi:hypothetical protein